MENLIGLTVLACIGWLFAVCEAMWWRRAARDAAKQADDCLALCNRYRARLDVLEGKDTDHE